MGKNPNQQPNSAESTRRKVVVTFYSIVLWISARRGYERSGEPASVAQQSALRRAEEKGQAR